jgi:hypothetical protein
MRGAAIQVPNQPTSLKSDKRRPYLRIDSFRNRPGAVIGQREPGGGENAYS